VAVPRHKKCLRWLADKLDASSERAGRETGMQSKIPWFRASRREGFRKRNAVCHLQGMVVWLQDYMQFMSDDVVG
jgi:hypothetical protein